MPLELKAGRRIGRQFGPFSRGSNITWIDVEQPSWVASCDVSIPATDYVFVLIEVVWDIFYADHAAIDTKAGEAGGPRWESDVVTLPGHPFFYGHSVASVNWLFGPPSAIRAGRFPGQLFTEDLAGQPGANAPEGAVDRIEGEFFSGRVKASEVMGGGVSVRRKVGRQNVWPPTTRGHAEGQALGPFWYQNLMGHNFADGPPVPRPAPIGGEDETNFSEMLLPPNELTTVWAEVSGMFDYAVYERFFAIITPFHWVETGVGVGAVTAGQSAGGIRRRGRVVGSGVPSTEWGEDEWVLSQSEIEQLAVEREFPDPHLASAVAMAESSGRVRVVNSIGATGLYQVLTSAHPQYDPDLLANDPEYNTNAAYEISDGGRDWSPWEAFTNGAYLQYM